MEAKGGQNGGCEQGKTGGGVMEPDGFTPVFLFIGFCDDGENM